MREKTSDDVAIVLVGNKCDMTQERVVSSEVGQRKADSLGVKYFETSTKENSNITETFEALLDSMMPEDDQNRRREDAQSHAEQTTVNLGDTESAVVSREQPSCAQC